MLDIDTLNALQDLTASSLYEAEVAHLPKPDQREVEEIITSARRGEQQACHAFVESCLAHALGKAHFLYHAWLPRHDDLLDLVQEASLRMVAALDRALATSRPAAYLRGIARRAILDYCIYHSSLIQLPEYSLADLKKYNPRPASVVSYDQPRSACKIQVELIEAPAPQKPEEDEERQQDRYAILQQALSQLDPKQQEAIVNLYRLNGQPQLSPAELGPAPYYRNEDMIQGEKRCESRSARLRKNRKTRRVRSSRLRPRRNARHGIEQLIRRPPLDPRQFAAAVIQHPNNKLYQCWLSTNGQDVICVSAHHQREQAEDDVKRIKSFITSGQLYDPEKATALFEQLKQSSDEAPSPLPDDLVNTITRAIVRAVVHQDKK